MRDKTRFSSIIYEYFVLRMKFRYYHYNDTLPTIESLCREFGVSAQAVTAALHQLQREGYITMQNGQPTKVVYRQTKGEFDEFVDCYYARRMEAFLDLYQSAEQIFVPMLVEGLSQLDEREISYMLSLARQADFDDRVHFFSYVLKKLDNPLALNLFWEITLFQGFPFTRLEWGYTRPHPDYVQERLQAIVLKVQDREWDDVRKLLMEYQHKDVEVVAECMERHLEGYQRQEQIPFVWRIYHERPQICYSMATQILYEIYLGEYKDLEYLPSYEKMAEKYGVSISTMRRTIKMLNQIGATESVNGVGTRVFTVGRRCHVPDFTSPAVRRNLAHFVQSFELIIYSCQQALYHTLQSLTLQEKDRLVAKLRENLRTDKSELTLWHLLICITGGNPLKGVRQIYAKVFGLFLWGYPLKASQDKATDTGQLSIQFTETVIEHLAAGQFSQCAAAMRNLVSVQFIAAEKYLLGCGIKREELRLTPAIRLLLTK